MPEPIKKVEREALEDIRLKRNRMILAEHQAREARATYERRIVEALIEAGGDASDQINETTGEITPRRPHGAEK